MPRILGASRLLLLVLMYEFECRERSVTGQSNCGLRAPLPKGCPRGILSVIRGVLVAAVFLGHTSGQHVAVSVVPQHNEVFSIKTTLDLGRVFHAAA